MHGILVAIKLSKAIADIFLFCDFKLTLRLDQLTQVFQVTVFQPTNMTANSILADNNLADCNYLCLSVKIFVD